MRVPGWDTLDGKQQHPAVESLKKRKKCGYNASRGSQSRATIYKSGGGLLTAYGGVKLTKEQVDTSHSHNIYEATEKEGQPVYVDAEKEDSCYHGRFINDPRNDI